MSLIKFLKKVFAIKKDESSDTEDFSDMGKIISDDNASDLPQEKDKT